jgi:hypothetical protein
VAMPLPTHRTIQTQNKRTPASCLEWGFETTIPVFELAKIVHALHREAGHCDRLASLPRRQNHPVNK